MNSIKEIRFGDKNYPKPLSQIADPPKILYCRGNLNLLKNECFAIVGTRKLTSYGKEVARKITVDLTQFGFTIVSGLAMGIDAIAHQTTLEVDGKTIAVLGGGVGDRKIGPQVNLPLAKNILKNNGLLVSEYSDKEEIFPINFAARDRIISGLSKGVLIVEADEKSGALITAKFALDQNRDVFAVPGNIFSSKSKGPNNLIQAGAKLVTSAQDILDEYGYNLTLFDKKTNTLSTKNTLQKNILDILNDEAQLSVDEIIAHLPKTNMSDILIALSTLEINSLIKKLISGKYQISR